MYVKLYNFIVYYTIIGHPPPPPPSNIPSEMEKGLLGNGEWPFEHQSANSLPLQPIPQPPAEGEDYDKMDAYKMTAKPRGLGE